MTQGPQPPEFPGQQPGTPPHFQGQPGMPPQFPPPAPPARSSKTVIIVVIAVVIALIAGAALAFALTRSSDTTGTAAPSAAASSSAAGSSEDFRLRGTLKSKASICSAAALTSQQIPKFAKDLDYSTRPNLDEDITKARQDLSRLAARVSPDGAEPIRSTVQDWITSYVDLLAAFSRREPPSEVKFKFDLVSDLAARMNQMCKEI